MRRSQAGWAATRSRSIVRSSAANRPYLRPDHDLDRRIRRGCARQDAAPSGAQPSDRVVVTGTIGDAALGLLLRRDPAAAERWGLTREQKNELTARYLVPQPRTTIAELLGRYASAAMDVSDGLAGDLAKLCRASGVAAEIEAARVPLSQPARAALARAPALIEPILTGGDDYEVLACVPPGKLEALREQALARGVALTDIGGVFAGVMTGDAQPKVLDHDGRALAFARSSFSHF